MLSRLLLSLALGSFVASSAVALPSLQLGPGAGSWTYDTTEESWLTADNPLELAAYANAVKADGGNGDYAWDQTLTRYAYLVVSAEPKQGSPGDVFDVTLTNDGGNLALVASGNGTPSALPPHGIFSTYYEIYEFQFNGSLTTISNTQPPGGDPGQGYKELITIAVNSLGAGVTGLHFDLFTISGSGQLTSASTRYFAKAPFSHDAGFVPEPGAAGVFSVALLVAAALIRRHRAR